MFTYNIYLLNDRNWVSELFINLESNFKTRCPKDTQTPQWLILCKGTFENIKLEDWKCGDRVLPVV